ncbi:MAG: hypothetical protein EPN74_09590 [Rhodanobacter sp.]|nr:MAG: hypothetical protein EPN74_09590 [Rhodanobacter sp.]
MLAKTEIIQESAKPVVDKFASTLRTFQEHARAIASGKAEGDTFSWFLASEYEWEMEMACQWLVESPASRLSEQDKVTLRHFLGSMPAVREAIISGRQAASNRPPCSASPEWSDWLEIAALPSWNHFTVRTAILLSQLGNPAQNDKCFFARD